MVTISPAQFRRRHRPAPQPTLPAPPPAAVHVANVTQGDDPPGIVWTFSKNIASVTLPIGGLTTDGNQVTGLLSFLGSELIVSYDSFPDVGDPWAALALVTGITFVGGGAVAAGSGVVGAAP